jgi:hypothetical protein
MCLQITFPCVRACAEGNPEFWLGCCKELEDRGLGANKVLGYPFKHKFL